MNWLKEETLRIRQVRDQVVSRFVSGGQTTNSNFTFQNSTGYQNPFYAVLSMCS